MKKSFAVDKCAGGLTVAVLGMASLSALGVLPATAQAAEKAANKPAGKYVTGDFHNHTTCSDGTLSLRKLID